MSLKFKLGLLFLMISMSACVTPAKQPSETAPPEVFQEIGLATGQPGMNVYPADPPGKTTKLERPYDGAPPLIPHSVVNFDITRSRNDCLNCHLKGLMLGEGHTATKVPLSHYTDEYTGEHKDGGVVGIRYNCLQCHVPQSAEEPPVSEKKR